MRTISLVAVALLFNLYWYGAFLSFPLIGEDGAANYSFLLENLKNPDSLSSVFPYKWLEGLGQPNAFVTVIFDPFSWIMLLPFDTADTFRISMALRATFQWASTFFLCLALFKDRSIAVLAASLNMLMSFTLGHSSGVPTVAGIPNATHYAVFPLLLWTIYRVMVQRHWIGWWDAALLGMLSFFFITFPLSSIIGYLAALAFGTAVVACAGRDMRKPALRGMLKLALLGAALLLLPEIGMWRAWSALVNMSARAVFSDELFTYGRGYSLPYMWHDVPIALKLCIVLALAPFVYTRRWPRSLRIVLLTLLLIVGGTQTWSAVKDTGLFGGGMERLPRAHYFEFYTPVFYAMAAAFALRYWTHLIPIGEQWKIKIQRLNDYQRDLPRRSYIASFWFIGCSTFIALTTIILTNSDQLMPVAILGVALGALVAAMALVFRRHLPAYPVRRHKFTAVVSTTVVLGLFGLAVGTWAMSPTQFHPTFARTCTLGLLWCKDHVGKTIGADATPITEFLRRELSTSQFFEGRAELLLMPSRRFQFPVPANVQWTPELFERLKAWYRRAFEASPVHLHHSNFYLAIDPDAWHWGEREKLRFLLQGMSTNDDVNNGVLPEDVAADIRSWSIRELKRDLDYLLGKQSEVEVMAKERNRAYAITGNGMMLRALPMQEVPVASSYEQALDFLYYLLWTRYLNEGGGALYTRSINFTALETLHVERLALLGVRYIIARESMFEPPPALTKVTSDKGYSVYEIPSPNVAGYAPRTIVFGKSLSDELALMRSPDFDPRYTAILSTAYREKIGSTALAPMRNSRITLGGNDLVFEAESAGEHSLAVLPFRYSSCLIPTWSAGSGQLVRTDLGLVGLAFSGRIKVRLRWGAGYANVACLREDLSLASEAKQAAKQFPE